MIPEVTFLAVAILIGYSYRSRLNLSKPKHLVGRNYVILYESAIWGLLLFGFGYIIAITADIPFICTDWQYEDLGVNCFFEVEDDLVIEGLLFGYCASLVLPIAVNILYPMEEVVEKQARETGLTANVIFDALAESKPVEITTSMREVYIGWIVEPPKLSENGKIEDLALLPISSGFRNAEDFSVQITMDYEQFLRSKMASKTVNDTAKVFSITLPIRQIVSIRFYSKRVQHAARFQHKKIGKYVNLVQ